MMQCSNSDSVGSALEKIFEILVSKVSDEVFE
jgi:hypothetical protein